MSSMKNNILHHLAYPSLHPRETNPCLLIKSSDIQKKPLIAYKLLTIFNVIVAISLWRVINFPAGSWNPRSTKVTFSPESPWKPQTPTHTKRREGQKNRPHSPLKANFFISPKQARTTHSPSKSATSRACWIRSPRRKCTSSSSSHFREVVLQLTKT
jgi:hypothetical protein